MQWRRDFDISRHGDILIGTGTMREWSCYLDDREGCAGVHLNSSGCKLRNRYGREWGLW